MNYPETFPKEINIEGKNILIIDFSLAKKEEMSVLRGLANKVMILDHHKTAYENFKAEEGCFFELNETVFF